MYTDYRHVLQLNSENKNILIMQVWDKIYLTAIKNWE